MTTIAVSDGWVAADTQLTSANYALHASKLFRMPDGGVITGSGEWALVYARIQWHLEGEDGDPPELRGSEVLIVKPDKSIWLGERDCPAYPILDRTAAIGCGRDLARSLVSSPPRALVTVSSSATYIRVPAGRTVGFASAAWI